MTTEVSCREGVEAGVHRRRPCGTRLTQEFTGCPVGWWRDPGGPSGWVCTWKGPDAEKQLVFRKLGPRAWWAAPSERGRTRTEWVRGLVTRLGLGSARPSCRVGIPQWMAELKTLSSPTPEAGKPEVKVLAQWVHGDSTLPRPHGLPSDPIALGVGTSVCESGGHKPSACRRLCSAGKELSCPVSEQKPDRPFV